MTMVALLLGAAILAASCSSPQLAQRADITTSVERVAFIPAPAGGVFGSISWIPSVQRIAVAFDPPNGRLGDTHIFTVGLEAPELRIVPLPADPPCSLTFHVVPAALSDGRLGYIQGCIGTIARVPQEANALMAYDFASGQATRLFPYYLHANQVQYTLAPDLSAGLISDGRGLEEHLLWLRPSGTSAVSPLPFQRVWAPNWSPDGRSVAVGAVADGANASGLSRLDLPWGLYVLDAQAAHPRLLQQGFAGVGQFAWSPDGRWLLGSATLGTEPPGLWLIDVATGRASLVVAAKEQAGGAAWLPDGTIAVAVGVWSRQPLLAGEAAADRVGIAILRLPPLH